MEACWIRLSSTFFDEVYFMSNTIKYGSNRMIAYLTSWYSFHKFLLGSIIMFCLSQNWAENSSGHGMCHSFKQHQGTLFMFNYYFNASAKLFSVTSNKHVFWEWLLPDLKWGQVRLSLEMLHQAVIPNRSELSHPHVNYYMDGLVEAGYINYPSERTLQYADLWWVNSRVILLMMPKNICWQCCSS